MHTLSTTVRRLAAAAFIGTTTLVTATATPATAHSDPVSSAVDAVGVVQTAAGTGTAFAVTPGRLLTAAHVITGARRVRVVFGARTLPATVLRTSPAMDLALLSTSERSVAPLPLRREAPRLGEPVYAVGAALGDLSVTRGIVSGQRRADGFQHVQTDAAINPGSSGGPLLGEDGQVIGLVVSKLRNAEGIALAVSAADLRAFLDAGDQASDDSGTAPSTGAGATPTRDVGEWWPLLLPAAGLAWLLMRARPRRLRVRLGSTRPSTTTRTGFEPDRTGGSACASTQHEKDQKSCHL